MTTVGVTCRYCAEHTNVPAHEVTVHIWTGRPDLAEYTFTCPQCRQQSARPAPEDVIDLLLDAPVRWQHHVIPDEANDPVRFTGTRDDLLDALTELRGDITCPTR